MTGSDVQSEAAVDRSNPRCDMPECWGTSDDETHAARDPSDELLEICDSCLNEGWRGVVEVLD